ncbi:DeSI-like protein [Symbiodinium microadriaticum]|uniref:DeSI-like protein n=1 Tax=Symbiodinium microadriaticum TaxID=2951 RepID=A0A1Q9EWQ7_SYMMI|nr:DeSI-like protein [Symbiodinium microadriaticum]
MGSTCCSGQEVIGEQDVILNVYDVGNSFEMDFLNNVLYLVGTGVYHAGTQIGKEVEWAYGYTPKGSGVFHCEPKGYPFKFRQSIKLGTTPLQGEVKHRNPSTNQDRESYWGADVEGFRSKLAKQECRWCAGERPLHCAL